MRNSHKVRLFYKIKITVKEAISTLPYFNYFSFCIRIAYVFSDDVKIVYDLELPSEKPKYIEDLIDNRGWAISTLFVGKDDMFPRNLTAATETIFHVNMMPVYGLNVY